MAAGAAEEELSFDPGADLEEDGITPRRGSKLYTQKDYWDFRFAKEEGHEWLAGFDALRDLLGRLVKPTDRILLVGCGNSRLSRDMFDAGYRNLVSTDYSATVIEAMRAKHADCPELQWDVQDMRSLTYEDHRFDVVLDKAAMDALLADGADVWDPPAHLLEEADAVCRSTTRVLRPGGLFLQVSFSQPHFRRKYLDPDGAGRAKYGWSVEVHKIPVGFGYFAYAMRKELGSEEGSGSA